MHEKGGASRAGVHVVGEGDEGADLDLVAGGGPGEDAVNDLAEIAGGSKQEAAVEDPGGDLDQRARRNPAGVVSHLAS